MILALRLREMHRKNYALEKLAFATSAEANGQALVWWRLSDTISVIVQVNDREDARYTRPEINKERIPVTWPEQKTVYGAVMEVPEAPVVVEDIAPSLVNPEDELPVAPPTPVAMIGVPCCWSCKSPYPPTGRYPGDDEPNPSGRLEVLRCPECGKQMPFGVQRRAIWMMYLAGQSAMAQHDQALKLKIPRRPV